MALNFPASPSTGDVHNASNNLSYVFDGVKWITQGSYNTGTINTIKLDSLTSSFNGSLTTFNLTSNSISVKPANPQSVMISLGGVIQEPTTAYTINSETGTITFASAPASGTAFFGIVYSRLPQSTTTVDDGAITNAKVNATAAIDKSKLNISDATTSASGYMSASDKTKLDGIEASATADQTNAEIRAAVEAATDSNVFTDADHTKLNSIEASATADQTASEIVALVADQTIAPSEIDMEDNEQIKLGTSDDLLIYHNGESLIQHTGAGVFKIEGNGANNLFIRAKIAENSITCVPNGAVQLFNDNVKMAETSVNGFNITDSRLLVYNSVAPQIRINTASGDSSATRIILGLATGSNQFINGAISNDSCFSGPSNILFGIGNARKFRITDSFLLTDVEIRPNSDNSVSLGSSGSRFTTLHSAALNTGDINMSNLNDSGNEVDGSKGSWTLQEGADDLFLINRVSGKKYKFNLTEIS